MLFVACSLEMAPKDLKKKKKNHSLETVMSQYTRLLSAQKKV